VGFFYSIITLRGPTQDRVVSHLRHQQRDAYVSPTVDDITVVYDRECEDLNDEVLHAVTSDLSRAFDCVALVAFLFDDDFLWYALYQHGRRIDAYNSEPAYFDDDIAPDPSGGDAAALCSAFGRERAVREVDTLLHFEPLSEDEDGELVTPDSYLPAEQLHKALAQALGLPAYCYSMSYYSIERGPTPAGADRSLLVKTLA
jgi:hypothetical protein